MKLRLPFEINRSSLMAKALIVLLILVLPFNVIGIVISVVSYQNSVKSAENVITYTLDSQASTLDSKIYNTHTVFYNLATDTPALTSLSSAPDDSRYLIYRHQLVDSLTLQIRVSNVAESFFFYVPDRDDYIPVPNYTAATSGTRPYYKYIENLDRYGSQWFLSEDHTEMVRIIYNSALGIYYGAAIDLSGFLEQYGALSGYRSLKLSFETSPRESTLSTHYFTREIEDGIYLTASITSMDLNSSPGVLPVAVILFFILYLALIPCLYRLMKRYVAVPLNRLNFAQLQLRQGHDDYRITEPANSMEFGAAYESFNQMASSLQKLQKAILEKELSNKQLQIDFLQLQIRPHFLLNSFNVLYTLIQSGHRENAQEMVLFLSDYFRYLFRSVGDLQLFSKERKLIEDYMNISKIYYPVSFEVSYQLEPILDVMRVPPLVLHSFMENIIAHALLPDRKVHIVFSGEYEDGTVTFYISDDGKGMDEEAVRSINGLESLEQYSVEDGKNVGIKNSIWRLRYYYGDQVAVVCESEVNVGTTFTITIPYNLEEEY